VVLDIQSKEVIDKISDDLKVQPAMSIPRMLADKIQLVYGVNPPKKLKYMSKTVSDGTTSTVFTTSATRRTFVVAMSLAVAKDVVATSIQSAIRGTPFGDTTRNLLTIRTEPVTVMQGETANLTIPEGGLELDKNSLVTVTNSTAIASIDTTASVYFYETDPQ